MAVDSSVWGPYMWRFLHYSAAVDCHACRAFADYMRFFLPCAACRNSYCALLDTRHRLPAIGSDMTVWVYRLHNLVNRKLHKRLMSQASFEQQRAYFHPGLSVHDVLSVLEVVAAAMKRENNKRGAIAVATVLPEIRQIVSALPEESEARMMAASMLQTSTTLVSPCDLFALFNEARIAYRSRVGILSLPPVAFPSPLTTTTGAGSGAGGGSAVRRAGHTTRRGEGRGATSDTYTNPGSGTYPRAIKKFAMRHGKLHTQL